MSYTSMLRRTLISAKVMDMFPIHPDETKKLRNITGKDVRSAGTLIPQLLARVDGPVSTKMAALMAKVFSVQSGHSHAGSMDLVTDTHRDVGIMIDKYATKFPSSVMSTNDKVVVVRIYLHGWIIKKRLRQ